jgi:hypothetical protein
VSLRPNRQVNRANYRLPLAEVCLGVSLSRSAVEGVFLDPVEASVDQQEGFAVNQLKLHVDLVAVHVSIERQLILVHALERKISFPVLVVVLCELELRRHNSRVVGYPSPIQ